MFKKIILFLSVCLWGPLCWGEVGVLSVTDEDKHSKKEDFYHTFEYYVVPLSAAQNNAATAGKCQATRIARRWFATAAHCVAQPCKNGCEIQLDLLEYPTSALARVTHTPKKPAVFVHPGYSKKQFVKNDFALLRLDLDRSPLTYYRRPGPKQKYRLIIPQADFNQYLEKNRRANAALAQVRSPKLPPLVLFDKGNYVFERKLSVISIFNGQREVKLSTRPVYYVKELGFAYTDNFGVRQGMSGSGVMTNTGELVGMISGEAWIGNSPQKEQAQHNYFMFVVFNGELAPFMEQVMGGDYYKLDWKDAYPYMMSKTRKNFTPVIELLRQINARQAAL